jgi:hypothetical protein
MHRSKEVYFCTKSRSRLDRDRFRDLSLSETFIGDHRTDLQLTNIPAYHESPPAGWNARLDRDEGEGQIGLVID